VVILPTPTFIEDTIFGRVAGEWEGGVEFSKQRGRRFKQEQEDFKQEQEEDPEWIVNATESVCPQFPWEFDLEAFSFQLIIARG